ncbi:cbb3-type cytochrome c oxidase subunit I [Streptomyces sp. KL116D]|uniref:cbb3-type cytochrome c oxidase subunit I n=1 Tax=Streptomyces sp. KL116D TaxID=3045152 RepID=UPI003558C66B
MPLQIGAPDVAFPRLNMFAYWLRLFGSLIAVGGFLHAQGAADFGWFAYSPLSDAVRSPGIGADMWIMGLAFSGFGTILGAVNFTHHHHLHARAPGMTMFRMPIFVWNAPRHGGAGPAGLPGPRGRAALPWRRTAGSCPCLRRRRTAAHALCSSLPLLVLRTATRCRIVACPSSASSAR